MQEKKEGFSISCGAGPDDKGTYFIILNRFKKITTNLRIPLSITTLPSRLLMFQQKF